MVPGRPYSFVATLESGSTSWTALLDARRPEPGADTAAVTAARLREVLRGIFNAGQAKTGAGGPEVAKPAGRFNLSCVPVVIPAAAHRYTVPGNLLLTDGSRAARRSGHPRHPSQATSCIHR